MKRGAGSPILYRADFMLLFVVAWVELQNCNGARRGGLAVRGSITLASTSGEGEWGGGRGASAVAGQLQKILAFKENERTRRELLREGRTRTLHVYEPPQ